MGALNKIGDAMGKSSHAQLCGVLKDRRDDAVFSRYGDGDVQRPESPQIVYDLTLKQVLA